MPVLSPAGVQEILDYGLYGFALSRFAGVWVGLKTDEGHGGGDCRRRWPSRPDAVHLSAVRDARGRAQHPPRRSLDPAGRTAARYKRFAAEAFAGANGIDRRMHGKPGAKIGFVAAGKNWLDLVSALATLGIDGAEAERLGITTYKVGQTWPLDMNGFHDWAEGLDLIVVVEEKRKLIEVQVKEAIFDDRRGRRVYGYKKGSAGEILFPSHFALDPADIAQKLGRILIEEGRDTEAIRAGIARVEEARRANNAPDWRRSYAISVPAVRTTPPRRCPRMPAPAPGSAVTSWPSGWTATPRPIPIWAGKAPTGSARRRSPPASTCSRTSARGPTTIPASWRSAPRSPRMRTSPTRSSSTTPSP
jgi:indolepyruvate ferredoxin oxidoreductase